MTQGYSLMIVKEQKVKCHLGWKLTAVHQPLADDFESGPTILLKSSVPSAWLAGDFLQQSISQY